MKKVNNLLANKMKREVNLLRDENRKKDEEILKLKYILGGIKDLLNIDERNIKINLKTIYYLKMKIKKRMKMK